MVITREIAGTKQVLVQSIVTYQMYGDANPSEFLEHNFGRSKETGHIDDFDVVALQRGVWGIVMCVVLVRWYTDMENTHEQASEVATSLMNSIVGDSDVEVIWTGALEKEQA